MTFLTCILKFKRLGGSNGARAEDYSFSYGKENENDQLETRFFVEQTLVSAVKVAPFISDRVSYTV
jgi:hypothetical protein